MSRPFPFLPEIFLAQLVFLVSVVMDGIHLACT
jgi:hypothetical protein